MNHESPSDKVLTRKEGGTRWLIFNQPKKLNAISVSMADHGAQIIHGFAAEGAERVLVVAGSGDRAFVSGADISEFDGLRGDAKASEKYNKLTQHLFFNLRDVEKPTIAMIKGYCFGGGVALATCCDIRVCAEDSIFSVPASRLGVGYSHDFIKLLADLVGPARTKEILYTAQRYTAAEALAMGLVNQVVPNADLESTVRAMAETIAENAPLTVRATKIVVSELLKDEATRDNARGKRAVNDCFDSEDFKEGRQAFAEKRKPVFTGR